MNHLKIALAVPLVLAFALVMPGCNTGTTTAERLALYEAEARQASEVYDEATKRIEALKEQVAEADQLIEALAPDSEDAEKLKVIRDDLIKKVGEAQAVAKLADQENDKFVARIEELKTNPNASWLDEVELFAETGQSASGVIPGQAGAIVGGVSSIVLAGVGLWREIKRRKATKAASEIVSSVSGMLDGREDADDIKAELRSRQAPETQAAVKRLRSGQGL